MMKKEYLAGQIMVPKFVKPEYLKRKSRFIIIELYKHKKYGAVAHVRPTDSLFDDYKKIPKKIRKKFAKRLDKAFKSDKPVDTSNWMRVRDIDRKIEIAKNLFTLIIAKDDWHEKDYRLGRINALMWDLHAHTPPRSKYVGWMNHTLTNMLGNKPNVSCIMEVLEAKEYLNDPSMRWIRQLGKSMRNKKVKGRRWKIETVRRIRANWLKKQTKNMIKIKVN